MQEQENCTGTKIVPLGLSLLLMSRRVAAKKLVTKAHLFCCVVSLYDNMLFLLVHINRSKWKLEVRKRETVSDLDVIEP